LNKLFADVTIASGGVLPNIHAVLLPKTSGKKEAKPTIKEKKVKKTKKMEAPEAPEALLAALRRSSRVVAGK